MYIFLNKAHFLSLSSMSDIQARLKIRDDERKAAAYQKKQERDDRRTDDETSDHFSKECASRRASTYRRVFS